ncbi:MAG: hypothetical protein JWO98_190 [Frankiales bacterium]|nr:hypothetical protein [Frankiales bacterium]
MQLSTSRLPRAAAGLLAGALILVPLAACQVKSDGVSCSGTSCSTTLSGKGATAKVLGNTVGFAGTSNGQAVVTVAGHSVSCSQGQSVSAGPLRLECTKVTDSSVELRASLG